MTVIVKYKIFAKVIFKYIKSYYFYSFFWIWFFPLRSFPLHFHSSLWNYDLFQIICLFFVYRSRHAYKEAIKRWGLEDRLMTDDGFSNRLKHKYLYGNSPCIFYFTSNWWNILTIVRDRCSWVCDRTGSNCNNMVASEFVLN